MKLKQWIPGQPNVAMRRITAPNPEGHWLVNPGDFYFCIEVDHEIVRVGPGEQRPTWCWFNDNRGAMHRISINPHKQENGAGWKWDGNYEQPTFKPSIKSWYPGDDGKEIVLWHGYIRGGIVGFEC